jgi:hypothetical protein
LRAQRYSRQMVRSALHIRESDAAKIQRCKSAVKPTGAPTRQARAARPRRQSVHAPNWGTSASPAARTIAESGMPTMPISDVGCLFFELVDVEQQKGLLIKAGKTRFYSEVSYVRSSVALFRNRCIGVACWRGLRL